MADVFTNSLSANAHHKHVKTTRGIWPRASLDPAACQTRSYCPFAFEIAFDHSGAGNFPARGVPTSYVPNWYVELSHMCPPTGRLTRYYLPTLLCTRRVYVWAPLKLVTKPSDISATVRSWTDGRLDSLRGKTV
eukprot:3520988-Pleurochrysis_carterae.AAC.5